VVRTVPIDDPGDLPALLPAVDDPLCWLRGDEGMVGWGVAAQAEFRGADRFADADSWWTRTCGTAVVRDEVDRPGTGPVAFGSFAFTDRESSLLTVPEVVVGRWNGHAWLTIAGTPEVLPMGEVPVPGAARPAAPARLAFADGARNGSAWMGVVADAVRRICAGELDKVVLARDLIATAAEPVDLRYPVSRLVQRYPACWTYCVQGLVGATPELLVRLSGGLVTSRVLAGTIRRTGDDAHDLALAASLARSSKDLEEHEYAVQSVATSLAPHCTGMNVPDGPFVLHLPNVMHLATDVTGVLRDDVSVLRLAGALHPSAAVCGTPTGAAQALIAEAEGMSRGRYAGPVGWIGAGGDGEFGIALRCAQRDPHDPSRLRLFAGCGIVAGSDPAAELAESVAKTVPMRDALALD